MWNRNYSEAAVEVLDLLSNTDINDVKKIPTNFIQFLKDNSATDYVSKLDKTKPIDNLDLRKETRELLGIIYRNWWATEEERQQIYKQIRDEERKMEEELERKYKYEDLFKHKSRKN